MPNLCVCLIPNVREPGLCLVQDGRPPQLPTAAFAGDWLPAQVEQINESIRRKLRLRATVRRHLAEIRTETCTRHLCVLESLDPLERPPDGARWIRFDELEGCAAESAEERSIFRRWRQEEEGVDGRLAPWEKSAWFARADQWIEEQLRRLGLRRAGLTEQVKGAWSVSTVLRAPTTGGVVYFKADYSRPPGEPQVMRQLSGKWADALPVVLASDIERHWLLMKDLNGVPLSSGSPEELAAAAEGFARIQVDCAGDWESWLRLGCPDLRVEKLIQHTAELFRAAGALARPPWRLDASQAKRLRASLPLWQARWRRLGPSPALVSLAQLDFRRDNVRNVSGRFVYFDWTQTAVTHPFFSLNQFLDDFFDGPPPAGVDVLDANFDRECEQARRRVRDAYLSQWTAFHPMDRLQEAFTASRQLNPLFVAIRLYLERPFLDPESPYGQKNDAMIVGCLRVVLRTLCESRAA